MIMLRKVITVNIGLILMIVISSCGDRSQLGSSENKSNEMENQADLVLLGGDIATVDADYGNVSAMAINDYKITAVGSDKEISEYIGEQTQVIELNGRFVMPGFIEGHGHYMSLGRSKQILDLNDVGDWSEIVRKVAVAVDKSKPGEWIFGRGWHQDKWQSVPSNAVDGVPINETLNKISPENPVILGHASGHAAFWNDAALEIAGVNDDTLDPEGGTIVRDSSGRATGLMRETAQRLIRGPRSEYDGRLTPQQIELQNRERAKLAAEESLRNGITSFHDAGASFETIDFFKKLEAEGELDVRLYVMVRGESNALMDQALPQYKMVSEGNDFLTVRSIKRQIDGALGAHGAWLLDPYLDLPETDGLVLETVEDISGTAEIGVKHGFQVNTHAIGDRANREILDLYENIWQQLDVDGKQLRWRIEHAQHIDPEDVPRFGGLGVIASIQAVHGTSDGPWIPSRLGDIRAKATSQPWRDLFNTGAILTNGTDVPVERIDPIASYYSSVTRKMINGDAFYPEHKMTRVEAIETYTINNAYAAFEENFKGTLTPGKYADFIVLSKNLLTIKDSDIPSTLIDMTYVGGELKYQR
ncbi:MAG: putative amidohydrolase YtcJ [Woeseiaceae bacterium]|jgi:predicted amidohydrolase YtcJ|tara:strand:- start:2378 stop:4141 length:1764 start_codon:yes stop_codon:yes gene_type:complete